MFPLHFLEQIKAKNVVLFLGAGASFGAVHPNGKKIPNGQELSDLIAEKFLGDHYKGKNLSLVAELAISESSLFELQNFVYEVISPFRPSEYHLKIAQFPWNAIFTTNYDFIIEEVYRQNKKKVQQIYPVVRNTPEYQIRQQDNILPYYKVHGCLSVINDDKLPLILTIDQFINYHNGRERLFERLLTIAYDYPILFIGYSLSDPNIRTVLQKVDSLTGGRAMSYIVSPTITDEEMRFWQSRRFTIFKMSLDQFFTELEKDIPEQDRIFGGLRIKKEHPLFEKFIVPIEEIQLTESLKVFINNDIDYVHRNIQSENTDPKSFYKGFFENWDPIIKNLDVRRGMLEGILFNVFLNEKEHSSDDTNFYLIHGNAGSGKSVFIKRLAFEASVELDRICIFLKSYSRISIEPVVELYKHVKERIYLFIDGIATIKNDLLRLLENAAKLKIPLTILGSERTNVWNIDCEILEAYLTADFRLKYLSDKEINELLVLLETHNSLNALKYKSHEERVFALSEVASRELLVALYEATNSKPFEQIILDEYNTIGNPRAQSLYLTVAILQRLGSEARAGLISRVHGISLHEFKEKLFRPLQYIVFDRKNPKINDFVYLTRHTQVAEIIFTTVLTTPQERFDEYVRIITNLNLDFESDKAAYLAMTNAKQLISIFPDPLMIRNFYDIAARNELDKIGLLQQRAIFEMNSPGGSIVTAERLLRETGVTDDPMISHSLAELILKKAEKARYDNEFYAYIDDVITRCNKLVSSQRSKLHPFHTILKALNLKLRKVLELNDDTVIQKLLKDAEKYYALAKQIYPDDQFILETESTFNELINNKPDAKDLLKKAFDKHKSSPFIALRYSTFLEKEGDFRIAADAIKESLEINPHDKDLNFKYAELLFTYDLATNDEIIQYLRRSFTLGDSRFQAQFWYARALYLKGERDEAFKIFKSLAKVNLSPKIKNTPRGRIKEGGKVVEFTGEIITVNYNYGFIRREKFGDDVFLNFNDSEKTTTDLGFRDQVKFNIAFNYKGAVAINIKPKHLIMK